MNGVKTSQSRFLRYKQLAVSHEDSIIVDFYLVLPVTENKKERLKGKLGLPLCLSSGLGPAGTADFICLSVYSRHVTLSFSPSL